MLFFNVQIEFLVLNSDDVGFHADDESGAVESSSCTDISRMSDDEQLQYALNLSQKQQGESVNITRQFIMLLLHLELESLITIPFLVYFWNKCLNLW